MNLKHWLCALLLVCSMGVFAQTSNLDVNTPAITEIKNALKQRHTVLRPLYVAGALGLAEDGTVVLKDVSSVPLAQRGQINALLAADNADRQALYREIARANSHPEWEDEVRRTFAQRWIERAPAGWWVQKNGVWTQK